MFLTTVDRGIFFLGNYACCTVFLRFLGNKRKELFNSLLIHKVQRPLRPRHLIKSVFNGLSKPQDRKYYIYPYFKTFKELSINFVIFLESYYKCK